VFLRVGGRTRHVLADPRLASVRQEAPPLGSMKITDLELLRFLRSDTFGNSVQEDWPENCFDGFENLL
jgi:hypothetical protein